MGQFLYTFDCLRGIINYVFNIHVMNKLESTTISSGQDIDVGDKLPPVNMSNTFLTVEIVFLALK